MEENNQRDLESLFAQVQDPRLERTRLHSQKGRNFICQLFTPFMLLFLLCSRGERHGDTSVVKYAGDVESADEAWLLN